ncbi:hypothetical protein M405DRAFT_123481 [Rhizopogon salebrosus TDB-379]|nr:hypothetical protein M405DRAFT_123481 [Rhizopogon salebrosus TDB-379]
MVPMVLPRFLLMIPPWPFIVSPWPFLVVPPRGISLLSLMFLLFTYLLPSPFLSVVLPCCPVMLPYESQPNCIWNEQSNLVKYSNFSRW